MNKLKTLALLCLLALAGVINTSAASDTNFYSCAWYGWQDPSEMPLMENPYPVTNEVLMAYYYWTNQQEIGGPVYSNEIFVVAQKGATNGGQNYYWITNEPTTLPDPRGLFVHGFCNQYTYSNQLTDLPGFTPYQFYAGIPTNGHFHGWTSWEGWQRICTNDYVWCYWPSNITKGQYPFAALEAVQIYGPAGGPYLTNDAVCVMYSNTVAAWKIRDLTCQTNDPMWPVANNPDQGDAVLLLWSTNLDSTFISLRTWMNYYGSAWVWDESDSGSCIQTGAGLGSTNVGGAMMYSMITSGMDSSPQIWRVDFTNAPRSSRWELVNEEGYIYGYKNDTFCSTNPCGTYYWTADPPPSDGSGSTAVVLPGIFNPSTSLPYFSPYPDDDYMTVSGATGANAGLNSIKMYETTNTPTDHLANWFGGNLSVNASVGHPTSAGEVWEVYYVSNFYAETWWFPPGSGPTGTTGRGTYYNSDPVTVTYNHKVVSGSGRSTNGLEMIDLMQSLAVQNHNFTLQLNPIAGAMPLDFTEPPIIDTTAGAGTWDAIKKRLWIFPAPGAGSASWHDMLEKWGVPGSGTDYNGPYTGGQGAGNFGNSWFQQEWQGYKQQIGMPTYQQGRALMSDPIRDPAGAAVPVRLDTNVVPACGWFFRPMVPMGTNQLPMFWDYNNPNYSTNLYDLSNSPMAGIYYDFTVRGTPGRSYQLQVSTNLASSWFTVTNAYGLPVTSNGVFVLNKFGAEDICWVMPSKQFNTNTIVPSRVFFRLKLVQ